MKFLDSMKNGMKRSIKVGVARVKAKSPELLLVAGGITFVATVVVACKQTLKCDEILEEHQRDLESIETCREMAEDPDSDTEYTEEEARKDKAIALLKVGGKLAKVYAPCVVLGVVSLTCFGASYGIMRKRNVGMTVAYAALDTAFKEYRDRVKKELGEDADQRFRYGFEKVSGAKVASVNENGESCVEEKDVDVVPWDENLGSNGTVFYFGPATTKYYQVTESLNDVSIMAARNNAQIDFDVNGHLFLNDVLKMLGMEPVPYGQLIGWLKGVGDPYIDFRTKKTYHKASADRRVNPTGAEYEVIYEFDFNTCGVIWDKI